jgi:hypothetical protein
MTDFSLQSVGCEVVGALFFKCPRSSGDVANLSLASHGPLLQYEGSRQELVRSSQ